MLIPAAMFIETALDQVKTLVDAVRADQLKELHTAIGAQATEEVAAGYLLGLQTARVVLSGMPAAIQNKVSI